MKTTHTSSDEEMIEILPGYFIPVRLYYYERNLMGDFKVRMSKISERMKEVEEEKAETPDS